VKISPVFYLIAAVVILLALYSVFKPKILNEMAKASPAITETQAASPISQVFELSVKNKKLVSGPDTIKVTEGDSLVIKISADEDEELHLHGYDKSVTLVKDAPAELSFVADVSGRFVYELEKSNVEIGALEVSPK